MTQYLCSFCPWKGHLHDRSSKMCPACGSALLPLTPSMQLAHNTKTVELMKDFNAATETPAVDDWSADRHREGADR